MHVEINESRIIENSTTHNHRQHYYKLRYNKNVLYPKFCCFVSSCLIFIPANLSIWSNKLTFFQADLQTLSIQIRVAFILLLLSTRIVILLLFFSLRPAICSSSQFKSTVRVNTPPESGT